MNDATAAPITAADNNWKTEVAEANRVGWSSVIETVLPWTQPRTWWSVVHLLAGGAIGMVTFTLVVTLVALTIGFSVTLILAIPVAWFLFVSARWVSKFERVRFRSLLDEELGDRVPPLTGTNIATRFIERFRIRARWMEILYELVRFPTGVLEGLLMIVTISGSLALVGMPFYVDHLPGGVAHFYVFDVHPGTQAILAMIVGLIGIVFVAPWTALGLARVDVMMTRWMIGTPEENVLTEQVHKLEHQRGAAVDSAEAERRRIERDLHDGAQQRMVAVAMSLGAAQKALETDPERGRELVAEAQDEAKAAIRELRDLVRGIHPAILSDRGLDAALSAVVARCPVPVTLNVRVEQRPPASIESAAYFFVSEALTNVARHAQATRASVSIERAGDRLVVEVTDNGVGGADAARGTGLQGLADRVEGLGGWMTVMSPVGGPTTLMAELPCGS